VIYEFNISVSRGVSRADAELTHLQLHPGRIYRVELVYMEGSYSFLHCVICDRLMQLWPRNPFGYFTASKKDISFEEDYEIQDPPYELLAYCWNDDEVYSHSILIRLGIARPKPVTKVEPEVAEMVELMIPSLGIGG